MRTVLHLSMTVVVALAAAACGDDDGNGGDDAPEHDAAAIDADPNAPDATPVVPDAAVGVQCGAEMCDPATEECCVDQQTTSCVAAGTCPGTTVGCDGPEDCADTEACCVGQTGSECVAADTCEVVVCHVAEDCPDVGDECCDLPAGAFCAPNCPGP